MDIVNSSQGKKIIGSKGAFKTKYNCTGKVQKQKARLAAKGFLKKYGEDYNETFAPSCRTPQ